MIYFSLTISFYLFIFKTTTSKHTIDIKEKDLVQLNIDLGQRGLAGDDSWWSKPQEKYQIKGNQKHSYSFYIIPFMNKSTTDLINLSKQFHSID